MKKKLAVAGMLSPIILLLVFIVFRLVAFVAAEKGLLVPTAMDIVVSNIWRWIFGGTFVCLIVGAFMLVDHQDHDNLKIGNIIRYGRKQSKKHMHRYLWLFLFMIVVSLVQSGVQAKMQAYPGDMVYSLVYILLGLGSFWLTMGLYKISLDVVRDHQTKNYRVDIKTYLRGLIAYIGVQIIVGLGLILFIIPGIIFGMRLLFVQYLIIEKKMLPAKAIRTSWKMTKTLTWDLFALNLLLGLINILGALAFFVGLLRTLPMLMIANAYIYKNILEVRNIKLD